MDQAKAFVAVPFFALEQRHFTAVDLLNARFRLRARLAQVPPLHHAFAQPLAADTGVSGDQPHRHMVHVKTRAHRFVQQPQAHADALGAQQTGKGADQPRHIGDKAFVTFKVAAT